MPASHGIRARRKQGEAHLAIARDAWITVRCHQSALDRRLDGPANAAKCFVISELKCPARPVVAVELLQREGEQRQGIAAAALLDVF